MKKQTISILGCGWLGLPVAKALVSSGFAVKGSTTRSEKLPIMEQSGIESFLITLDPEFPQSEASFFGSDILLVNVPPRNKHGQEDYHRKQLLSIRENAENQQVKKVLYVSSTGVYPDTNKIVKEEDAEPGRRSRGGVPLLEMEQIFLSSDKFETTIVRFGGLHGEDRHPGRFLSGKQGLAGADNPVNMIHLTDCIGVISCIIAKGAWGQTYNACAPTHPSRKDFYERAAAELNMPAPTFSDEIKPFKIVSSEKLINELGYLFKVLP